MTQAFTVRSPVAGTVVAMADVPDPVFAEGMVGPGVAVDPVAGAPSDVLAPCDGIIVKLHPHAFVLAGPAGRGILVHLGIDTVQLAGQGFTLHTAEGETVIAGQRLVSWSPSDVAAGGRSPLVLVVALDLVADGLEVLAAPGTPVTPASPIFVVP
ncbi:PTS glucose transporter subunit IIA [Myceligenerans cantabricum]